MNTRRILMTIALLGAGLFTTASIRAADDDAAKASADLKKIQGSWTTQSSSGEETVYTFKDNKLTVKAPSRTYQMTVTLDEKAKPHKSIDLHIDKAPEDAQGKTSKGIYKLDGDDKLSICFRPEGDRPTEFKQVEMEQFLVELKRKKD